LGTCLELLGLDAEAARASAVEEAWNVDEPE
jgi:hypothetical protein